MAETYPQDVYQPPTVSIDTNQTVPQDAINLDTNSAEIPVPADTAVKRASRAHFGLNERIPKTWDQYYQPMVDGQENQLRKEVASDLDLQKNVDLHQTITNIANRVEGPLTPEDYARIQQTITGNKPTNPLSVFEENFANKYINNIFTMNDPASGSWFNEALSSIPGPVQDTMKKGTIYQSMIEYARKGLEDAKQVAENQSWGGYLVDLAKGATQLYPEIKLRGQVPGVEGFYGLGSNLEEQANKLFEMPTFEAFRERYDAIMTSLKNDNPGLALQFANAVIGQSRLEKFLSNSFTFMAVPDLVWGTKLATSLVRKITLYNQTQSAARYLISSAANLENRSVGVVAADATGNLSESATRQAAENVQAVLSGNLDPVKFSLQSLTSNLRVNWEAAKANPGRYGQEIVNRLDEYLSSAQSTIMTVLRDTYRVNRGPASLQTEHVVRAMQDEIKRNYKGLENAIIDISEPRYHQPTNTWHYDIRIANSDGTLFETREQALGNAQLNRLAIQSTPEEINLKRIASQYDTFSKYRQAMRAQGMTDKTMPIKGGIQFDTIKKSDAITQGYTVGSEAVTRKVNPAANYPSFAKYRQAMRAQGIRDKDMEIQGSIAFNDLKQKALTEGTVEQQGLGHFINYTIGVNETGDIFRDGLLATQHANLPESGLIKSVVAWIRSPEETLSREENVQRKVATHAPAVLIRAASEIISKPLNRLPWKYRRDFNRLLEAGQNKLNPETGKLGYFFKTPGEIEDWYHLNMKRAPDRSELEAYWAFKGNVEFDAILRDVGEYRNRSRVGAQSHTIVTYSKDPNNKEQIRSKSFDGVQLNHLPGGDDGLVIIGKVEGNEKLYHTNNMGNPTFRKKLEEGIAQGRLKVIEIYKFEDRPLEGFGKIGDQRIRYVVTSNVETAPLSYNQINRQAGGHLVPDYDYYIKQAKVKMSQIGQRITHAYEGDTTVMPIQIRAMGRDVAKHMDEVRKLLREGKVDEAKAYHTDKKLPFKWDEHHGWYKESKDPQGYRIAPRLSLEEPIQIVPRNKMTIDMSDEVRNRYLKWKNPTTGIESDTWRDGTSQGSLARTNQIEFSGERDVRELFTINDIGGRNNPLYSYKPARFVDPITSMNRGLNRIIQSTFMDDMKMYSVEHWLAQAMKAGALQGDINDIRRNPFWHFHNAKFSPGAELETKSQLMSAHRMIKDFLGAPSLTNTFLNAAAGKIVDSIYKGVGPRIAIVADHALPYVRDPLTFMRSATYHMKMGLYAIPQFFTQALTYTNILALSPLHAPAGAMATLLHSWASINRHPEVIAHMDRLAGRFGWRPGDLTEAMRELRSSGFINVGTEHALLDTPLNNKIITNGVHKFLYWGETPFRLGAESVRASAFYTAYREFRHGGGGHTWGEGYKGSTAALTDIDRQNILSRAALLDHNMSRAGSSLLHTGIMAPFGQFLAYSMRLSEMMTGKRLTGPEKARLFGISSILYGVPAGGLGLWAFPAGDWVRQKAKESGYVVGDDFISNFIMEGLPALMTAVITGKGDFQKGNWFDYSKFGSKGVEPLGDLLDADKTVWDIFGGSSASTLFSIWRQSSGFRSAMGSAIKGDGKAYPIKMNDMIDILREVKSFNSTWTSWFAYSTANWYSRNETVLKNDVTPFSAIFSGITGTHPTNVPDVYLTSKSIREREAKYKYIEQNFTKEFHRGLDAGDPSNTANMGQSKDFFTRAFAWMEHYPVEKRHTLIERASTGRYLDLIQRLDWQFFIKDVDPTEKPASIDTYRRLNEMKQRGRS